MDHVLEKKIKEAERELAEAEKQLGAEHPDLVDKLMQYAALLRQTQVRVLDAVNVEARAKSIRAKVYAEQAEKQKTTSHAKPTAMKSAGPGVYVGVLAVSIALASLFLDQSAFILLAPLSVLLAIIDVVMTKGQWWRAAACALLLLWGIWGIKSLPEEMLITASPLDRLNYEVNNPALVSNVRKLEKDVQVLNYKMRMSTELEGPTVDKEEWGTVFTWAKDRGPQQLQSMSLASMMVPDHIRKQLATAPMLKICNEIAVPRIIENFALQDVKLDTGELEEINGYEFAVFRFSAIDAAQQEVRGFVYVTKDKSTLVALAGHDVLPGAEGTIPEMEASVYTFRKAARSVEVKPETEG